MPLIRPFIPQTPVGDILRNWDYRYVGESKGASLFEEIYLEVMMEVFGRELFGTEAWCFIVNETAIFADFYSHFDEIILGDDAPWFGGCGRNELLRTVIDRVFSKFSDRNSIVSWGAKHQFTMEHLFFHGRLARLVGFKRGPISLEGSRATIVQGAIYNSHGRATVLTQSLRSITDLAQDSACTVIAGGPSDRFTSYYTSDVRRWQNYEYKLLSASECVCSSASARSVTA